MNFGLGGYTSGGVHAARPEQTIKHRVAHLKRGIGAVSQGAPAKLNEEKAEMRQEATAIGMTGKQYRRHLKDVRRKGRERHQL